MVPVAPIIIIITLVFTFHMCCIYIVRSLYYYYYYYSFPFQSFLNVKFILFILTISVHLTLSYFTLQTLCSWSL
jgi:hypothetical protein